MISEENYRETTKELQEECSGRKYVFIRDEEMCEDLKECYKVWETMFRSTEMVMTELYADALLT